MPGYILTAHAVADLETIWQYVAKESGPAAADRLEEQFQSAMMRASEAPGMGYSRPAVKRPDVRFLIVHNYLIVYKAVASRVEILRIVHGARDLGIIDLLGLHD